eukprot:7801955-Ditylum_brightwellii.AAC.1
MQKIWRITCGTTLLKPTCKIYVDALTKITQGELNNHRRKRENFISMLRTLSSASSMTIIMTHTGMDDAD